MPLTTSPMGGNPNVFSVVGDTPPQMLMSDFADGEGGFGLDLPACQERLEHVHARPVADVLGEQGEDEQENAQGDHPALQPQSGEYAFVPLVALEE